MMKLRWASRLLLVFIIICSHQGTAGTPNTMDWRYMMGTNADEIWSSKTNFYRDGKPLNGSSNGAISSISKESLRDKEYRWSIGKGRKVENQLVPDEVEIEWISFHDKKRYGITLKLPDDLGYKMAQRYHVLNGDKKEELQRNIIVLGLSTGGYVEVFLTRHNLKPDIFLIRALAPEVESWYDKKKPVKVVYKTWFDEFDEKYGTAYQEYPVPIGMDWAPIMDSYRANQPKTDLEPVN